MTSFCLRASNEGNEMRSDRPVTSNLPGKHHSIFADTFDKMEEVTLWHVIMKVQSPFM